jgi:hypothetical protein
MSEENVQDVQEATEQTADSQATPQTPTPEQALNTLAAAARQARLTYEEHAAVDGCARVIAELVQGASTPAE